MARRGRIPALVASGTVAITAFTHGTQAGPAVRVLAAPETVSVDSFASVAQVHPLSRGRLLLNDGAARRLLLLDSNLRVIRVVADSAPGSEVEYGVRAGRLLPWRGDSSVLMDPASLSMLVLDGEAKVISISSTPRVAHITYLSGSAYGNPGIDGTGRLVYRISDPTSALIVAAGGGIVVPNQPDSAPVLRLDLDSRVLDSAGMVKIQKRIIEPYKRASGSISSRSLTTPMPVVDDWAVLADGSVAFLRQADYHIDWLNPDGSWTRSPVIPFDWQRMTDEHKAAFVDSVRIVLENNQAVTLARYDSINLACFNVPTPARPWAAATDAAAGNPGAAAGAAASSGATTISSAAVGSGGRAGGNAAGSAPGATAPGARPTNCPPSAYIVEMMMNPVNVISPTLLPDYKPAFASNSTRADADTNLWIRVNQMKPVENTTLYDVVSREGRLFDRIRISNDRTLVGFGSGGIAFLATKAGTKVRLERVRWR
jgi:hypothetical protein